MLTVAAPSAFALAMAATVAVGVAAGVAGVLLQPAMTIDAAARDPIKRDLMRVFLRAIQRAFTHSRVHGLYAHERRH